MTRANRDAYRVRTARGVREFRPEGGVVLPHEHVIVDSRVWWEGEGDWRDFDAQELVDATGWPAQHSHPQSTLRQNLLLSDWYLGARELRLAKDAGTQLVVDLTVLGSGPNAELAVRAAELAGIDLVISSGRYLEPALPASEHAVSEDELVERWLAQIADGYPVPGGTGDALMPGVIGEIGTSWDITDVEATSLRAAGRVQAATGMPFNIHVHPFAKKALQAIGIAEKAGADPSRIAISHLDCEIDLPQLEDIMRAGAFVEMDNFGTGRSRFVNGDAYPDDAERLDAIEHFLAGGFGPQLLLSHDINHRNSLVTNGGWGYRHLAHTVRPLLADRFGEQTALQLTAHNPLAFLHVDA
jgi:phosphotriesterase-related protein